MYVQQGSNISAKMFEGVSDSASDTSTHSSLPSLVHSGYGDSGDSGLDTDNVPGDQPMKPEMRPPLMARPPTTRRSPSRILRYIYVIFLPLF